jgi:predicted nucleotidyltransferase
MFAYERDALTRIIKSLKERFPGRIKGVYAFGSRVRGDHDEWSDFDVLIIVKNRDPSIENEIIGSFVDQEIESGILFTPLIKDLKAFESEKSFKTPFYDNLMKEGLPL